jgi:hypothetical protein
MKRSPLWTAHTTLINGSLTGRTLVIGDRRRSARPRAKYAAAMSSRPRLRRVKHRLAGARARALALSRMGTDARRGRRYGERFAREAPTGRPADPPGTLEAYFDAHTEGPGLWKWRHYFPIYERHLARFVGRGPQVVEIGIFSGGSLGMWLDYFGEGSHVHGVDIEPACRAHEAGAVSVSIGDQADPGFWKGFLARVPSIDVVIDDGGHAAAQQIATLEALLPRLNPGGVYVCEDIHGRDQAFHAYVDGLARNLHAVGPGSMDDGYGPTAFQRAIGSVHRYPFVTIIEKRGSELERLVAPKHGTRWEPSFYASQVFPGPGDGRS